MTAFLLHSGCLIFTYGIGWYGFVLDIDSPQIRRAGWHPAPRSKDLRCKPLRHIGVPTDTEFVDVSGSIRIPHQQLFARAAFEDVTGETGRDRAAEEGIAATFQHVPSLPDSCRDDKLYELSPKRVAAQRHITTRAIRVKQNQAQWIAAIEMPDLVIFQPMEK